MKHKRPPYVPAIPVLVLVLNLFFTRPEYGILLAASHYISKKPTLPHHHNQGSATLNMSPKCNRPPRILKRANYKPEVSSLNNIRKPSNQGCTALNIQNLQSKDLSLKTSVV
ncbi:hypothetical protein [Aestuariivivens sediminicola]|uniref:hypothetical protein n=1 Tax=Aestuariivivens sediminicola TaxID=2913560 RepID=UPI001F57754B|nr:hypothetical protein [Aestuariivivens sediminicola]